MKKAVLLALLPFFAALLSLNSSAQQIDQSSFHVVIGAFAVKRNAVNFASQAKDLKAKYELNPARNLFYVYVMKTKNKQEAVAEALRLQSNSSYVDTWVYGPSSGSEIVIGQDINPVTGQKISEIPTNEKSITQSEESGEEQKTESIVSSPPFSDLSDDKTKSYFFRIFRVDNNETVSGDVSVVDNERSRKVGTYSGNKIVRVTSPGNSSGNVSILCEVFGYRKTQRDINYNNPDGEGISLTDSAVVVPLDLMRLQKGDIAVMYNVYFFKDAAVMRPESRYEVNSLLQMLQENPKYKIRIHGHTNGNAAGKIISLDKDATNYFSLNNTKDGFGSAKKLSEERAAVIRDYLVANGVNTHRMHIKAWGGKRPLVDKMHTLAQNNVRVEIEILEN